MRKTAKKRTEANQIVKEQLFLRKVGIGEKARHLSMYCIFLCKVKELIYKIDHFLPDEMLKCL